MNWKAYITWIQGYLGKMVDPTDEQRAAFEDATAEMDTLCGITDDASLLFWNKVEDRVKSDPQYLVEGEYGKGSPSPSLILKAIAAVRSEFEELGLL